MRLRKFFRLPFAERRLFVAAALALPLMRPGLHLLPFRAFRRLLLAAARRPLRAHGAGDHPAPERVLWAVEAAGRLVPWASTCLTRALTAELLLRRRGYPGRMRLGVARSAAGAFLAHAWVEGPGGISIDAPAPAIFVPLPALDGDGT
ncbi:MAG: lasso peptide biosynthesis B2 protein [Acidobacteria bacterium]|nr:lasso peptide biosynthesis B2 protein [Acidobacteriota bacterium]